MVGSFFLSAGEPLGLRQQGRGSLYHLGVHVKLRRFFRTVGSKRGELTPLIDVGSYERPAQGHHFPFLQRPSN
jgi:hypothetical protein